MALTKASKPKFESEEAIEVSATLVEDADTTVSHAEEKAAPTPEAKEATAEVKQAATEIVAKASGAVAAPTGTRFGGGALTELENMLPIEAVRQIGLAAPRLVIDTGGFTKDGKEFGKSLIIQLLSYNSRWLISPGISGDEGKELVRYSYDNKTVEGETYSPQEYLNELREDYPKASIKEYVDLWCIVMGPQTDDVEPLIGETVVIQLSPQSAGQFKFWQISQGVRISRGMGQPTETLKVTVERTKIGNETFGRAAFAAV